MSATATVYDAPPTLWAPAVTSHAVSWPAGGASRAAAAWLDAGSLRVACTDGSELVRTAAWLRAAGDGRDAIDVVLRPCGRTLTVTWRDGRRSRYEVDALRS